mgnify:CR=1 FL=1
MSLAGLKKKTTQQSYNKLLKSFKKEQKDIPNKIKTIGILADSRLFGSYDISRNLSQKLNILSKNFEIIIFENLKDDFVAQHYNTFNEKAFGMYGKIKAPNVQDFIDTDYDLLINYSNQSSIFMNLVALRSKAKFKVGFANNELQDLYDFMIDTASNKVDIFNAELAKYLQILELI